ncbi:hypothetical protein, partial [Crocosphaera sp. XPORK-15E]|uniref:hypothetical protein n=1 Tax=Crocosphaera sp. XPORK-15E TaxID=3110247 RepID=UPI002B1FA82D
SVELENTGLLGEIHGAVTEEQLYVLSVREPDNFFEFRHFSLISANKKTQETLGKVKRHDQVCLKGKLIDNPSPQPHILVESATIRESWSGLEGYEKYKYEATIPEELKDKTQVVVKVHAINNQGEILVVEYKDRVIPIFVETPELTKDLYRGDLIDISYQIQPLPEKPTHLNLNLAVKNPLKIVEQLVTRQGKEETLTGKLVKFPQSPQLKFDVYGIEVITQGIPRYFTLVNFEDIQEFEKIRLKLATIWNNNLNTVKPARNFLINPNVTIEVQGKINIISPQQANPQILLENASQIKVLSSLEKN